MILAEDEASLYLQVTLQKVWARKGKTPVVWSDPGRKKVCFYGSLNLLTGQETVTRTEKMNSDATAQHLKDVLKSYPRTPILLLWDRASWHGGEAVRQVLADHPRLEVMKLPVAAPDLNPQEHVWKAARSAISHNHRFSKLPGLADEFEDFLAANSFHSSLLDTYGYNAIYPMFA